MLSADKSSSSSSALSGIRRLLSKKGKTSHPAHELPIHNVHHDYEDHATATSTPSTPVNIDQFSTKDHIEIETPASVARDFYMSGKETAGSVSSAASSLKGKKPDIIKTAPHPDISGDTDRVSEMVLQLVKALGDATGILPELKALTSVRDENEALLRQMEEHQRGTDERERALQAEIEAKNALLFKFGKEWVEAVRNDAIIEHTSAELLKQRELEVIAAVKEKEAVIENILRDKDVEISDILKEKELEIADILKEKQLEIAEIVKEKELEVAELAERHEEAMENVKSTLEEAAAQHIEAAEKKLVGVKMERDDAVGEVEKRQAKIDELTEALSTTKARLKSETLDRRELENILETTNSQMGLRELDEEDFESQVERLENRFHSLCREVFYNLELPFNPAEPYHEGLKEELKRSGFISRREAFGDFPLLLSGTPSSRCILMALAENIIGTQLTTEIFRLVPLPPDTSPATVDYLESISRQLASKSWDNEARWRSISCTAAEADFEANEHVVNTMLDRLRNVFKPLFKSDIPALDSLMAQLNDLLREATIFWRRAQHSTRKIVPDMRIEPNSDHHPEHDQIDVPEEVFQQDLPSGPMPLPLFPKFSVLDENGRRLIFEGKGLSSTARSAVLGRKESIEYKKLQAARYKASLGSGVSVTSRSNSQRRRQSVSTSPSTSSSTVAPRSPTSVRAGVSVGSGGGVGLPMVANGLVEGGK